ncbi:MAG: extracellular solute-binding protein [Candidatus Nanopelagicales bacterium]|nr:extracellular solute-binding protein [Candidatus Nanopelagicales bacterium]
MSVTSKRRASFAAILAAGALLLSACGGDSTATDEASAPAASGEFPTTGTGVVNLYNWTDYIDPALLEKFTAETGIEVILDVFDSNETLLAKLQSGATGYDVIMPSDYMVQQMIELGMLQNVGVASFPNGKNIAPEFMDVYFDPGRAYTAPYMYGTTGIACNTKLEPECANIKSWKDLFTGNFANVNALKDQVEIVSAALRATGVPAADLCTTDTAKYIAAEELLAGFKPAVIDNDGGNERMITGQASIRTSWNGDTHRMKMENPDIIFIYPSEGLNFWSDHMAIPVGAPNLDNAKIFMNWMMDPVNMAAASNFSGYNNAISGTADIMSDELKSDPAVIVPEENKALLSPIPNCGEDARSLYTQVFTTWLDSQ